MKKIEKDEYNQILLEMLEYVDKICRDNDIKYSLIGGSLIGAIRDNAMIPWDDDIDIVLLRKDYNRLMSILMADKNKKFKLMFYENNSSFIRPFAKIVNVNTIVNEKYYSIELDGYGVFLDIFAFDYVPSNKIIQKIHYFKTNLYRGLLCMSTSNEEYKNLSKKIISLYAKAYNGDKWLKKFVENSIKYNESTKHRKYIMSNWPLYGCNKEVQKSINFTEFIDWDFNGLTVMISKNYHELLTTTFGDYMTPPPEDKRVSHNIEAYWKEGIENE